MPTKTISKTAAKKAPAKKAAVSKKVAKKAPIKKQLTYADNNTSFWVVDGQILNSLVALKDVLALMEKEVYTHHVSKDKNDFADWVEKVLGDKECAAALRKAKTTSSAKTVVVKYLKTYSV